jgi:hypothetical protein
MLGSTALGIGLGIGLAHIPQLGTLSRRQVAYVDLGGLTGGLAFGLVGLGAGYLYSGDWNDATRIAIPATMAGIGVGLLGSALLVGRLLPNLPLQSDQGTLIELKPPTVSILPTGSSGVNFSATLLDGTF